MTTSRPYRRALDATIAADEIARGVGTQFCARVAGAFARLWERGEFTLEGANAVTVALSRAMAQG